MNDAEIKLQLIRLIDSQQGRKLLELYELVQSKLLPTKEIEPDLSPIELGYKEMSEDLEREEEAMEWIECTNNFNEI